jgi:hypothetical protein
MKIIMNYEKHVYFSQKKNLKTKKQEYEICKTNIQQNLILITHESLNLK